MGGREAGANEWALNKKYSGIIRRERMRVEWRYVRGGGLDERLLKSRMTEDRGVSEVGKETDEKTGEGLKITGDRDQTLREVARGGPSGCEGLEKVYFV